MTPGFDPASVAEMAGEPTAHALDQFEPDNDGTWDEAWGSEPASAPSIDTDDDPRWVVWADAMLESAWAGIEVATSWLAAIRIPPAR